MGGKGGRPENLKKPQSTEEAREWGRRGGIASGKARKEKKFLSQIYAEMLSAEHAVTIDGKPSKMSGSAFVQAVTREILNKRDATSVAMLKEIREATETDSGVEQEGDLVVIIDNDGDEIARSD